MCIYIYIYITTYKSYYYIIVIITYVCHGHLSLFKLAESYQCSDLSSKVHQHHLSSHARRQSSNDNWKILINHQNFIKICYHPKQQLKEKTTRNSCQSERTSSRSVARVMAISFRLDHPLWLDLSWNLNNDIAIPSLGTRAFNNSMKKMNKKWARMVSYIKIVERS